MKNITAPKMGQKPATRDEVGSQQNQVGGMAPGHQAKYIKGPNFERGVNAPAKKSGGPKPYKEGKGV